MQKAIFITMIRYISLLLLGLLSSSLQANEPQLVLQPPSHMASTRVGDSVLLMLTLTNLELNDESKLALYPLDTFENKPAFTTPILLTLEKTGTFTVGPFELTVDGQTYTSNTQTIQVMDAWDGENEVHVITDKAELSLGEKFRCTIQAWVKPEATFQIRLDPDHPLKNAIITTASSSGNKIYKGERRRYFSKTWTFKPERSGKFIFSSETFIDWPEEIEMDPVAILVSEPKEGTP